jgi:hypothetical protein
MNDILIWLNVAGISTKSKFDKFNSYDVDYKVYIVKNYEWLSIIHKYFRENMSEEKLTQELID